MANSIPKAEEITKDQFTQLLSQYDSVIQSISSVKPAKPGSKTLQELDQFRYEDAVEAFSTPTPKRQMTHDDVKQLVEWKLRHGKFRPTLMNLVSSNDSQKVQDTITSAMTKYWGKKKSGGTGGDDKKSSRTLLSQALADMTGPLKGIGPATASLLLAVHDPGDVVFFSDEVFWWLCRGGNKAAAIKYNAQEYVELSDAVVDFGLRLGGGVSALEVEKVAYVLFKSPSSAGTTTPAPAAADPSSAPKSKFGNKKEAKVAADKATKKEKKSDAELDKGTKRKSDKEAEEASAGLRRSKRGKPT